MSENVLSLSPSLVFCPDHPRSGDLLQHLPFHEAALPAGPQAGARAGCAPGRGCSDGGGSRDAANHGHQDTF